MKKIFLLLSICIVGYIPTTEAAYVLKNGRLVDVKEIAEFPMQEHYNLGTKAIKEKQWEEAIRQFRIVIINFPDADLATESLYFLGMAYYHDGDVDLSNKKFSLYLEKQRNPQYFIEAFRYKLAIAHAFSDGARKHLFDQEKLPKIFAAREEAIQLYDEIANALPNHELAAKALFAKAGLLRDEKDFKSSVETYQAIIRKFPQTEFASESYVKIATTLLEECQVEFHNPDLLTTAEISLKKFARDFPKATEQLEQSAALLQEMKEVYAVGLYETGRLYERKSEPKASVIYYHQALLQFPQTKIAKECKMRIQHLEKYAKEIQLPENLS